MSAPRAAIFGHGGHARVVASLLRCTADDIAYVVPEGGGAQEIAEADFFARIDDFAGADLYLGIGDNEVRARLYRKLAEHGRRPTTLVGPNCFVAESATLGDGVLLCPGAVVMAGATLGDNTIVNTLASVDHDCRLGAHGQLAPGVTFAGATRVGERCFFGVKSATVPGIGIGDRVTVLAGALVTRSFGDDKVIGGVPARVVPSASPAARAESR